MHLQRKETNTELKKTEIVRARIAPELKNDAELILKRLGISTAQAINMFFVRIVEEQGWPYTLKIPNETTKRALEEYAKNIGLTKAKNTKALFKELNKKLDPEDV